MGDERGVATTLSHLGALALDEGDLNRAEAMLKQALARQQRLGDRHGTAVALKGLARTAGASGDVQLARDYWRQCLAEYEQLGDRRNIVECREHIAALSDNPSKGDERVFN